MNPILIRANLKGGSQLKLSVVLQVAVVAVIASAARFPDCASYPAVHNEPRSYQPPDHLIDPSSSKNREQAVFWTALWPQVLADPKEPQNWADTRSSGSLDIYDKNPYYWQFHGRPVLLLGGSSAPQARENDEGMFHWPNLNETLDKLVAAGGNYVRCLMSGQIGEQPVWPFMKIGDRYDLDKWNEDYWRRFETFLRETESRGIVSDIEVWATFDYYREPWKKNPFNPVNNVNYTAQETALPTVVDSHPAKAENDFFRTIPEERNVPAVLKYQQRFVDKILSYTLKYDHLLYCIDNETMVTPKWGAYWARYLQSAAAEAGKRIHITEMWDPHDLRDPRHQNTISHPELYSYVEIAQNNHQTGQLHYDRILEVREQIAAAPRPLNNVKIYGIDGGRFGTTQDAFERFWRNIFAGSASARFHEKHLGHSEPALRMIRSARDVIGAFDLFRCQPHNDLLSDREPNTAYCLAWPGRTYVVYFPAQKNVRLNLRDSEGEMTLRWYNIDVGQWRDSERVEAGKSIALNVPSSGQLVALLQASALE